MLDITNVVTSCSAKGWEQYGKKFVETFVMWPKEVTLHVVSEDKLSLDGTKLHGHKVVYWPLEKSRYWRSFKGANQERLWVHGNGSVSRPDIVTSKWRDKNPYNFRFDAYKFSKKVFAIELVAEYMMGGGRLLWIDADVITFAPVPLDLLDKVLPGEYEMSYLARVGYHSECGFIGYNLDKPGATRFIKSFAALYDSDEIFKLSEWHDSWVFDWLRNKLMPNAYAIPHKSKGHPFVNSELGRYMDHLKGKRKDKGRSSPIEQVLHSKLPYWQAGQKV